MSDEAEGNLLKISIAKQIFIHHASKLNYSINRKLLQNFFCKYIHVLNQHAIHLKLTLYYTSTKLEEKVLRDFKKRGALTPPFGLWHLMSDLPWSRDYDTCSFLEGCSSLAQCALLLTVLPWLSTAHPDPLCDPTKPCLVLQYFPSQFYDQKSGIWVSALFHELPVPVNVSKVQQWEEKGIKILYLCVFIAHSRDTDPFIRKKAQGAIHCHVCHCATTSTLKELLGGYHGREEKERKAKA